MEETGSKQCPTCRMAVTKPNLKSQATQHAECHKMLCRNCNTKFCFKCLAVLTDSYTCGCTRDAHGFVDPKTGKRISHLRKAPASAKRKAGAGRGAAAPAAAAGAGGDREGRGRRAAARGRARA